MSRRLFVTGKLAGPSLKDTLARMSVDFSYQVAVLNITVAALMTTDFLKKNLPISCNCSEVILPGLCRADHEVLSQFVGKPVIKGPQDLKDLPFFYGTDDATTLNSNNGDSKRPQIIAEIVDAPYLSITEITERSAYYYAAGADIIDLGCCVEKEFPHLEKVIEHLKSLGYRVSLDSFKEAEITRASEAGIDLILSLNSTNLNLAPHLKCPAVIIPDFGCGLDSLETNIARAQDAGIVCIADPILDPLNYGFIASLQRFIHARHRFPNLPFLMGIGNITELTDADSTGLNTLLMGVAAELSIDYVLTTEASSRTLGAVREATLARRLMHQARKKGSPPKNFSDDLITIKDRHLSSYTKDELRRIQQHITDSNFRIFVSAGCIYVLNCDLFIAGTNADELFAQLNITDSGHAFYLGRELYKAEIAAKLGKKYIQEQDLRWGYLS